MIDIYEAKIELPETVYIVCPGPKGKEHYHRIPEDAFVMATNKAVLIPKWYDQAWKVAQMWCFATVYHNATRRFGPDDNWWAEAMGVDCDRVFGTQLTQCIGIESKYSFKYRPDFDHEPNPGEFIYGISRTGCSIACAPLQYAFHRGVKRVIIDGCDMFGNDYMDGSINLTKSTSSPIKESHKWGDVEMMDRMIVKCKEGGMDVVSLSPTELNIEVI